MTTALYRRYRPDTFQDVIGQDHVTAPLMAALRGDRVTHAYLFSGPRGCGKTTSARILARCLNCVQAPTDTPCGVCPSCQDLATGGPGSLDVVEIDAASHNGVDDARDLRERAAFAPARDRYKIFILDEAHMVTPQGFNALLKLVEEPPAHVKFIFATTEPEKVIGTIRSRTHHYPFRLVPPDVLEGYLAQLCAAEHVEVGPGVFPLVTRAGGGSVRDTLSVMDQLIGGAVDGSVDYPRAVALLGYTDTTLLDQCVDAIAAADGAGVFRVVDRVVSSGHDPRRFVEDLLQRLRDLLVISLAGEEAGPALGSRPTDELARMEVQARSLGGVALSRAADATSHALGQMVGATSPRLQLELLVARLLVPAAAGGTQPAAPQAGGGSSQGRAPQPAPPQGGQRPAPQTAAPAGPGAPAAPKAPAQPQPEPSPAPSRRGPDRPGPDGGGASKTQAPRQPGASGPAREPAKPPAPAPSGGHQQAPATTSPQRATVEEAPKPAPAGPPVAPNPFLREGQAAAPTPEPAQSPAGAGAVEAEMIRQRWGEVLETIKRERRMSWALVSPYGQPGTLEAGVFSLLLPSQGLVNTFDHGGHAPVVAHALHQALGVTAQVRAVLSGGGDGPGPKHPSPSGPGGPRTQGSPGGGPAPGSGGAGPTRPRQDPQPKPREEAAAPPPSTKLVSPLSSSPQDAAAPPARAAGPAVPSAPASATPGHSPAGAPEDPGFNPFYEQETDWEEPPPQDWCASEPAAPGQPAAAPPSAPASPSQSPEPGPAPAQAGPTGAAAIPQEEPGPRLASVHRLRSLPDLPPNEPPSGRVRAEAPRSEAAGNQVNRFEPLAPVSWTGSGQATGPGAAPAAAPPPPSPVPASRPGPAPGTSPAAASPRVSALAASREAVPIEEDIPSEDDEDVEDAGAVGIEVVKSVLGATVVEEVVVKQEDS